MKIWVDADACPVVIRDLLYKAAEREGIKVILVANKQFGRPKSPHIDFLQVPQGLDIADDEIVKKIAPGDLVITGDIPLASRVIHKGGIALNPRGTLYTEDNIQERLSTRDFMDILRSSGIETGGPSSLKPRDKQNFANRLDQIITQHKQQK